MSTTLYVGDTPVWDRLEQVRGEYVDPLPLGSTAVVARLSADRWPVGLERALLARRLPRLELTPIALHHPGAWAMRFEDSGSVEHLLDRPPSELAAWRLWALSERGRLRSAEVLSLSRLLGGADEIRKGRMTTSPWESGECLEFLKPNEIESRLDRLLGRLAERKPDLPPMLHAVGIYFDTLIMHPLPDGNGRLARLLFLGSLRQTLQLQLPVCPLGPAIALNRLHVLQAYLAWTFDLNPRPLIDFIIKAISATSMLSKKLL